MMFEIEENKFKSLDEWLHSSKNIVAITHQSPDGDALGSLLAIKRIANKMGIELSAILPDPVPDFISWLDEDKTCLVYDTDKQNVKNKVQEADLIIVLDFNTPKRAGNELGNLIENSNAKKVMIDHHPDPNLSAFDLIFSYISACSTAEIIGEWLMKYQDESLITPQIVTPIYLGIVTDSGSFRYPSVSGDTHLLVGELLKVSGISHAEIHQKVFDQNSLSSLRLMGYALSNKLNVIKDKNVAYIFLDEKELKKYYASKGDTEGLVNYALSIKNITLAAFFKEQEGIIKISFRSIGDRAANIIAAEFFSGGGHKNAAGGKFEGKIEDAISKFKSVIYEKDF